MENMRYQLLVATTMRIKGMSRKDAEQAVNQIIRPIRRSGYYETIYGNTARYHTGSGSAFDVDAAEQIPAYLLDKWLRPLK